MDTFEEHEKPETWVIDWAKVVPEGMTVDEWLDTPDPIDDAVVEMMFRRG